MPNQGDLAASSHPHVQRLLTEHRWCGGQQEQNELVGHKMSVFTHCLTWSFTTPAIFFFVVLSDRLGERELTPRSLH